MQTKSPPELKIAGALTLAGLGALLVRGVVAVVTDDLTTTAYRDLIPLGAITALSAQWYIMGKKLRDSEETVARLTRRLKATYVELLDTRQLARQADVKLPDEFLPDLNHE